MSSGPTQQQYFIAPMIPGVRPQDPPDYDGVTFVYVFTNVTTPWTQPPVGQNVVLAVGNSVGFVPGMAVVIGDGQGGTAGNYLVVDNSIMNRLTVQNLGGQAPGTGFSPDQLTATPMPGPPGPPGQGAPGPQGPTGATGATGPTGATGSQGPT